MFHSWYNPTIRIIINTIIVTIQVEIKVYFNVITIGKIITISISKIKNRTAIRKNCNENGIRDDLFGSNPHSKGDIFSRSKIDFLEIIEHATINTIEITIANEIIIRILFIILSLKGTI